MLHAFEVCLPDGGCLAAASTVLVLVPLFHANSWGLAFAGPLVGARLVLPGKHFMPYSIAVEGLSWEVLLSVHTAV